MLTVTPRSAPRQVIRLSAIRARALRAGAGREAGDAAPARVRSHFAWTAGCVALFNPDVRELYEWLPDRAMVVIVDDGPVTRPPAVR